jgi:putative transposase
MAFVLRCCRELYNAALQERREAWHTCHTSITCAHQSAQLPAIKAVRPEYQDVHSQVLQDVLPRLDRAVVALFRRVQAGEKPGYPRFQRGTRSHSFTYTHFGNGAQLVNGELVLSNIGRIPVRWSRPLEGTIKAVTLTHEADGWYVCFACEGVPIQPLAPTRQETGIDLGLKVFLVTASGEVVANPPAVSERRESAREIPAAGVSPQEGQPAPQECGAVAGQEASDGEAAAAGFSPQDRTHAGAGL